jgi:hypothetical protein
LKDEREKGYVEYKDHLHQDAHHSFSMLSTMLKHGGDHAALRKGRYHFLAIPIKENGKSFPNDKAQTHFLKTAKVGVRIFHFCSRKRLLPHHSYEGGTKFISRCMDGY